MTVNTIAGLSELFLSGFIAGACLQIPLLRKKTVRVSQEQRQLRRFYLLDGWLVVGVLTLVSWLRLSTTLGNDTLFLSRFLYLMIIVGNVRLAFSLRKKFSKLPTILIATSSLLASLGILIPFEGVLGSAACLSSSGIIEPLPGVGFWGLLCTVLPLPLYQLGICIRQRQYKSDFVFCLGLLLSLIAAALDLCCTPEILAMTWVSLIGSRVFPLPQESTRISQSAIGNRSRIQKRT